MDSKFSVFRTSLQPSIYNNNVYNTSINIVSTKTEPIDKYGVKTEQQIGAVFPRFNSRISEANSESNNFTQSCSLNTPLNMMKPTIHTYGYINLYQRSYNDTQPWTDTSREDSQCGTFPTKYKSVLKKSKYGNSNKPVSTNKKISFENKNHVVFTVDKEFYINNNLKNSIWWSAQELLFIRNMVMTQAMRIQRNNPNLNIGQCIREICKYN
jgi:hypothetical protein